MATRATRPSITSERPLPPQARATLVFAATATMLAFYAAAMLSMAFLGAIFLLLLVVAAAAARVGAAGFVARLMVPPGQLFRIFAVNLWLRTGATYRLPLRREDAPRLFELLGDLARRMEVKPPETIVVEMHCGAWVELKGFARGTGRTTLGVGYDLLAGLNVSEVEAVFAHELAHARLVQRGFSRWLNKGLARLIAVTRQLSEFSAARKAAKAPSDLANWGAKVFDALTLRAARLVATYSRQDEFEADRTAADTCGASAIRSALIRLEALDDAVGRLPWSERLARLGSGEHFSQWLVQELARLVQSDDSELVRHAADPYSTHPSLRDRINALPSPDSDRTLARAGTGIELLDKPDRVADRLAAEIQRVLGEQERKNTRLLARDTKKFSKRQSTSGVQALGVIAIAFGVIIGLVVATGGFALDGVVTAVVSLAVGVALYRGGGYRDRRSLPVPAYGTLTASLSFETHEQLAAAEQALFDEIRVGADKHRKKREKLRFLIDASYTALQERDYLRAHVAARQALQIREKSIEARLAYAIAAASLGNLQQTQGALALVKHQAGFTTPSTRWGAAWAMVMLEDWVCEGLLQQLHDAQPRVATYAALLALAQLNRGKLQSATRNAQAACALDPKNTACTQLLMNILLLAGRAREAGERAKSIEDEARKDSGAAFLMVRLHLMLRDVAAANEWARVLRELDTVGEWLIALGAAFSHARLDDAAGTFFSDALATAYTPQANIGLAALATMGGDRARARQHLLAALKLEKARLTGGQTPASLFHEVVARLNALDERRLACKAWIATIPPDSPFALAGVSVLVCAPDERGAHDHLAEIIAAMHADDTALDLAIVNWREAPREQQPIRPVQPGVQFVMD